MGKKINLPTEGDLLFVTKTFNLNYLSSELAKRTWSERLYVLLGVWGISIFGMVVFEVLIFIFDFNFRGLVDAFFNDIYSFIAFGLIFIFLVVVPYYGGLKVHIETIRESFTTYYKHNIFYFHNKLVLRRIRGFDNLCDFYDSNREISIFFEDLKHILNNQNNIEIVLTEKYKESRIIRLRLSKMYNGNTNEIVAFLNERIKQAKADLNAE